MNVMLLLCDHAEVAEGKLFINGGGWDTTGSPTAPFSVAIMIWVPWDRANDQLQFRLALFDEDGQPIQQQMPDGNVVAIELGGEFQVGRPPGAVQGADLPVPLTFNFPPMPLPQGRYYWQVWLGEDTDDAWRRAFNTVAQEQQLPPAPSGPADFRLP